MRSETPTATTIRVQQKIADGIRGSTGIVPLAPLHDHGRKLPDGFHVGDIVRIVGVTPQGGMLVDSVISAVDSGARLR